MRRRIFFMAAVFLVSISTLQAAYAARVHRHGMKICALIINEMTEGRVSSERAKQISLAIARAGNKHFGRVTCGDMWLYLAIVYVESGFRNDVVNHRNCRGLFQVHAPSWAKKFGLSYRDLLNPSVNADAGLRVFKYYLARYKRLLPTLSAYNSDHPRAARGYAHAVLSTRKRIKKRYTELFLYYNEIETGHRYLPPL